MIKEGNQSLEDFKKDLQSKGPEALDAIYLLYKDEFVNFCRKFNIGEDKILDIYQDSMIAFYENVVSGKLSEMSSTIKTYIFSIGKYSIYNMLKKENKTVSFDRQHLENLDLSIVSSSQLYARIRLRLSCRLHSRYSLYRFSLVSQYVCKCFHDDLFCSEYVGLPCFGDHFPELLDCWGHDLSMLSLSHFISRRFI